ncbi:PI-PLC domain-containing protein [Streptomyces sp. NPDC004647]|uniref:PI-PLC domain-containing protein n=1 Tax=Streptomyces sp. NPDC004647 TaxID=3154671 RepID=UPI0033A8A9C5
MSRTGVPASTGSTALCRPPRRRRAAWWAAFLVVVFCTVVLVATGTARTTALNRDYYQAVLDDQKAYDRLYDEVLVDPESSDVARELLARLPVPQGVVTSNLKTVLPPTAVRALADQQISNAVGYLRGDRPALRMTADLKPVLANLSDLIQLYCGDLFTAVEEQPAADVDAFAAELQGAVGGIAPRKPPLTLPTRVLDPKDVPAATDALLSAVPPGARDALRPGIATALGTAGTPPARPLAGPPPSRSGAPGDVHVVAHGKDVKVVADLEHPSADGLALVRKARSIVQLGLGPVQTLAALLGALALLALWAAAPGTVARRLTVVGAALATGGALAAAGAGIGRLIAGDAMPAASASWPPSLARLAEDVQTTAADRLAVAGLLAAAVPLVAGLLLVGAGILWRVSGQRRAGVVSPLPAPGWAVTAGVAVIATAGAALAPTAVGGPAPRRCQGSSALCDRRYDEVAQLAAHNAMATTADRFIGPLQDPAITGQLDAGVRALLIDTHTWERPEEVAERLRASGRVPDTGVDLTRVIGRINPPRSGLWLCHSVCRGGAVALVPALRKVGDWLEAHPTEIVTLIVQDGISGADTARAFREADLEHLLYTPDNDPARPWPTLGEMVAADRRLVVFAEQADGPAAWYRNFYRYGMETPYAFGSPREMTCAPHRGGGGKRLFLMNHFVTAGGGSRLDAGEVNSRDRVLKRARACERKRGRPVTFIAVDYTTIGDARGAVDVLNAARASGKRKEQGP